MGIRLLLSLFLSKEVPADFLEFVSVWIKSFSPSEIQESTPRNLNQMLEDVSEKCQDFQKQFTKFLDKETERNQTFQFWCQFVFKDCFAYIALYLAMRSGNWYLRVAALKQMAALYSLLLTDQNTKS